MRNIFQSKRSCFFRFLEIVLITTVFIFGGYIISPRSAEALTFGWLIAADEARNDNESAASAQLPLASNQEPTRIYSRVPVTAYSSEVNQTDSSPFITASGTAVRHGVVATNFLPLGTRIRFPQLYGDKVFIVEDRMNARYYKHFDIWMEETADAKNFGIQWTTVEIF